MNMPSYTSEDAPVPTGTIVIERATTPLDLAPKLNRTAADVVRFMMQQGEMVTATQSLSDEMIEMFAEDVGADIQLVNPGEEQEVELRKMLGFEEEEESEADLSDYPDANFLDVILFNYGRCLYKLDRKAQARRKFSQLINDFPESDIASEANKIVEALKKAGF